MVRKPVVSTALLTLMRERNRHARTPEDLHAGLADCAVPADFSSVFRAAEKLATEGQIRKLLLEDGRARFELFDAHHDHLLCRRCGKLVPVPCMIADEKFAALERDADIVIQDHHLVLSGLCSGCRRA